MGQLTDDFIDLMHTVTWKPMKGATGGGSAVNGKEPSETPPAEIKVMFEAKTSGWAVSKFAEECNYQPWLMIGEADDLEPMQMGDTITHGSRVFKIEKRGTIYRPGDGYDSGEMLLKEVTTGGRSSTPPLG